MASHAPQHFFGADRLNPKLLGSRKILEIERHDWCLRAHRHFQDTIVVRVRQRRPPAEIDLNEARPAAKVIYEVVEILRYQTDFRRTTLQHCLVLQRQRWRYHGPPLTVL